MTAQREVLLRQNSHASVSGQPHIGYGKTVESDRINSYRVNLTVQKNPYDEPIEYIFAPEVPYYTGDDDGEFLLESVNMGLTKDDLVIPRSSIDAKDP